MSAFRHAWPTTIEEAVRFLERYEGDAHLLAGGTALALLIRQGLVGPGVLVDLARVPGLDGVDVGADGRLEIGSMCTLRRIERDPSVLDGWPALASTVSRVATVRIRNQATIGGNLAHADPAQDPPAILIALDAEVVAVGPDGSRVIPANGFFRDVFETGLGPSEVVTTVRVPPLGAGTAVAYEKFQPRTLDDYATVSVAARITSDSDGTITDARVVLGAAGPVPLRVPAAEGILRGTRPADVDLELVRAAAQAAADPVDDVRGSADYKREMAGVWAARTVGRLLAGPGPRTAGATG